MGGNFGDGASVIAFPCTAALNEVWRPDGPGIDWHPHIEQQGGVQLQESGLPWHIGLFLGLACLCCCLAFLAYLRCCCCCAEFCGSFRASSKDSSRLLEISRSMEL